MSDLTELGYYKLTGWGQSIVADTSDTGVYPDYANANCDVTLKPRLQGPGGGAPEIRLPHLDPPKILFLAQIKARLLDGKLRLVRPPSDPSESTDPTGEGDGVWLVAQTPALGLAEGLLLVVDVTFGPMTMSGSTYSYQGFTYVSPTVPNSVIDLASVQRISVLPPSGGPGIVMIPDRVRLDGNGDVVFSSNGIDMAVPLDLEVTGVPGDMDDITDATPVGKAVVRSETQTEARDAIGAASPADVAQAVEDADIPGLIAADETVADAAAAAVDEALMDRDVVAVGEGAPGDDEAHTITDEDDHASWVGFSPTGGIPWRTALLIAAATSRTITSSVDPTPHVPVGYGILWWEQLSEDGTEVVDILEGLF